MARRSSRAALKHASIFSEASASAQLIISWMKDTLDRSDTEVRVGGSLEGREKLHTIKSLVALRIERSRKMSTNIPEEQHTEQMDMDMGESEGKMGWKHWGLMLLCCLPMIAIAVLIIVGVWSVR